MKGHLNLNGKRACSTGRYQGCFSQSELLNKEAFVTVLQKNPEYICKKCLKIYNKNNAQDFKKSDYRKTSGPWHFRKNAHCTSEGEKEFYEIYAQNVSNALDIICTKEVLTEEQSGRPISEEEIKANFEFIVEAHNEFEKVKEEMDTLANYIRKNQPIEGQNKRLVAVINQICEVIEMTPDAPVESIIKKCKIISENYSQIKKIYSAIVKVLNRNLTPANKIRRIEEILPVR